MPGEPLGPVIVGVAGSPLDLAVVDLAAQESAIRAVPLVVVQVSPAGGLPGRFPRRPADVQPYPEGHGAIRPPPEAQGAGHQR